MEMEMMMVMGRYFFWFWRKVWGRFGGSRERWRWRFYEGTEYFEAWLQQFDKFQDFREMEFRNFPSQPPDALAPIENPKACLKAGTSPQIETKAAEFSRKRWKTPIWSRKISFMWALSLLTRIPCFIKENLSAFPFPSRIPCFMPTIHHFSARLPFLLLDIVFFHV